MLLLKKPYSTLIIISALTTILSIHLQTSYEQSIDSYKTNTHRLNSNSTLPSFFPSINIFEPKKIILISQRNI